MFVCTVCLNVPPCLGRFSLFCTKSFILASGTKSKSRALCGARLEALRLAWPFLVYLTAICLPQRKVPMQGYVLGVSKTAEEAQNMEPLTVCSAIEGRTCGELRSWVKLMLSFLHVLNRCFS